VNLREDLKNSREEPGSDRDKKERGVLLLFVFA
jgi:hypothetical protein